MYLPSMIQLTQNVNILAKDVIDAISTVGRIRSQVYGPSHTAPVVEEATVVATTTDAGEPTAAPAAAAPAPEDKHKKTYYEIISDDSDILRIVVQVMNGMSSTAIELQKYLSYWDKYKVRLYTHILLVACIYTLTNLIHTHTPHIYTPYTYPTYIIASVGDGQGGVHQEVRQVQPHSATVRRGYLQV